MFGVIIRQHLKFPENLRRLVLENYEPQGTTETEDVNINLDYELSLWFKEPVEGCVVFERELIYFEVSVTESEESD